MRKKVVKVSIKKPTSNEIEKDKAQVKPKFLSEKTIIVTLPTFSSIERFNQILAYFDEMTKLRAICNKNVLSSGKYIKVKINIEFPENNRFDVDGAYMYLSTLFCSAGFEHKIIESDENSNNPIAKCVAATGDIESRINRGDVTKLKCFIVDEKYSYEFDIIISVIETVHNISIEIIRDCTERAANGFSREVLMSVPDVAVMDLINVLEKRSFPNSRKKYNKKDDSNEG